MKYLRHFFATAERQIERHHAVAFGVGHFFVVADTEEDILSRGIFFFDVVDVGGCDDGDTGLTTYLNQSLVGGDLVLDIGVRSELEVEVVLTKDVLVFERRQLGSFVVAVDDFRWHFTLE